MKKQYFLTVISLVCLVILPYQVKSKSGKQASGSQQGTNLKTANPKTALEHNNRGVELALKGRWQEAIAEHGIAVEMEPGDTRWRTNLSAAHLEYGKWLKAHNKAYEAANQFRQAMNVDPANAVADAELDNCLTALKKNPFDYNTRKGLAVDADVAGHYDTSIVEWRKCVKIKDDPLSHAELGRVLLKAGKDEDGYKELRLAVGRVDWTTDEHLELAACHRQLGDLLLNYANVAKNDGRSATYMKRLANAGIEYRRAVTLNPGDAQSIKGLLQCAREAVAIRSSFDNHLSLAGAYLLAGDFAHARVEYEECFKADSHRPELVTARLAYHQSIAKSPLASDELIADSVEKIKKAIDQDPENARDWYILGGLRERQQKPDLASKCYEKAMQLNPNIDPDLKAGLARLQAQASESIQANGSTSEDKLSSTSANKPNVKSTEQQTTNKQPFLQDKSYQEMQELIDKSEFDLAINKGSELFQKNTKDGRIAGQLGQVFEKKGDLNQAKTWYRVGAGLGDTNSRDFMDQIDTARAQPKLEEADEFIKQGNYLKAASSLRSAIMVCPARADIHRKLADVLAKLGDKEGSKREIDQANKLEKGDSQQAVKK